MNEQNYYRVSIIGIVIDDQGRILLAREDNNMWDMLGGGIDHGEDAHACLTREIYEEAGLKITSISDGPLYFLTARRLGQDNYVANVVYKVELESLAFTPSDECQELRFFSPEEMLTVSLYPTVDELLKQLQSRHQEDLSTLKL